MMVKVRAVEALGLTAGDYGVAFESIAADLEAMV
jgi:hypothetical protein